MMKLTDRQKKMLGMLNGYHRRDVRLGGPGLRTDELKDMFGPRMLSVRRQLEAKGLIYQNKRGRWVTADWLDEWQYSGRWIHCSLDNMKRAEKF